MNVITNLYNKIKPARANFSAEYHGKSVLDGLFSAVRLKIKQIFEQWGDIDVIKQSIREALRDWTSEDRMFAC